MANRAGLSASRKQCCDILGWTHHDFDNAVRDGMPFVERPTGRGTDWIVFMGDVVNWIVEQALKEAGHDPSEHVKLDLSAERARLAREQADNVSLKNQVARGELLPAADVIAGWQAAIGRFRSLMLGVSMSTAPRLVLLSKKAGDDAAVAETLIRDHLIKAVDTALAELTNTSIEDDDDHADEGLNAAA